ncbi:MAG: ComEA family DNA-binding protein [Nakamurella sp.]
MPEDDLRPLESVEGDASNRGWATRLTNAGPWGELAEKWVPEPLRGARVDPGRRGAILLAVVAAIAAVVAAVGVWWTKPEPIPLTSSITAAVVSTGQTEISGSSVGVAPDTGSQQAGQSAPPVLPTPPEALESVRSTGPILVSVTGNVRHPGLVTVPADARVADAIAAAGGVSDNAQLTGLNLAAHLTDGASVVVAGPSGSTVANEAAASGSDTTGSGSGAPDAGAKISLNTADQPALQSLSGIGPVTAEAIIAYRTAHGPFTDLAQLQEVSGIGPATFARLQPHVTL